MTAILINFGGWIVAAILFVITFRLAEDKRDAQREAARYRMALKEERAAHQFDNRMHQNVYETNMQLNYDGARQQGKIDWQAELIERMKQNAQERTYSAQELPERNASGQFTTDGMKTHEKQLLAAVLKKRGLADTEIGTMLQIKSVGTYISAGKKIMREDGRFRYTPQEAEEKLLLSHGIVLRDTETGQKPF